MCGLVAAITKAANGFDTSTVDAFKELLFVDTLRGDDSTGVFGINNLGNVGIAKDVGTADKFINTSEYREISNHMYQKGWAIVGHNRKSTRGATTDKNAHPFWVDDKIVLVHNGSYYGDHKKLADTEVDSEAIAIHLSKNIDNYEEALQKVNSAYALIFYDVQGKKLNFIRNKDRPLYYVETEKAYFFASEAGMLYWILMRNEHKLKDKIQEVPEHTLYTFPLSKTRYDFDQTKLNSGYKYTQGSYQGQTNLTTSNDYYERWAERTYSQGRHSHSQACGWSREKEESITESDILKEIEAAKARNLARNQEKYPISSFCKPNAKHPRFKYSAWMALQQGAYKKGTRINVIVDDWIQPDPKDPLVFLTGKTLDMNEIPVIFKCSEMKLNELMHKNKDSDLYFAIDVDFIKWTRTEGPEIGRASCRERV